MHTLHGEHIASKYYLVLVFTGKWQFQRASRAHTQGQEATAVVAMPSMCCSCRLIELTCLTNEMGASGTLCTTGRIQL